MDLEQKRKFFIIEERELNFQQIYGNSAPIHLEIGCGKGEFLAMKSRVKWDKNFLGIEVKPKRIKSTLKKLEPQHHSNVRLLQMFVDAQSSQIFPPNSIEMIYINHPDPWPKRRHHKRRLLQDEFIDILHRILVPGGILQIITDHVAYAEWITKKFLSRSDFRSKYEGGYTKIPFEGHIVTYFEKIKRLEGNDPIFMKYKKVG
jgi:tRNA (guanine-N7-)-methyltransferase